MNISKNNTKLQNTTLWEEKNQKTTAAVFKTLSSWDENIDSLKKIDWTLEQLLENHPISIDCYIEQEDIAFLERAKTSLENNSSLDNFIKISSQIPMGKIGLGKLITFFYSELNHLNTRTPIELDSLKYFHPDFVKLKESESDIILLKEVLCFFKNNDDSDQTLKQGLAMISDEKEDLRGMALKLFYNVMFNGVFIFKSGKYFWYS